jgi:hypothetical protein
VPLTFYPHEDDLQTSSIQERVEALLEAAQRYKAAILETQAKPAEPGAKKRITPRDLTAAYNWEEIAKLLKTIRELPELNQPAKVNKAENLKKLAEIYEVLRAAKMPKLEAVRLALMNEANQLKVA